jgi:hypothetical protein
MELETRNQFACLWCSQTFARRHLNGRKPHYCSATCRQRAYEERRRGARFPTHAKPLIPPQSRVRPRHYESGRNYGVRHALRPAGLPDRHGRRPTLCGAWASHARVPFGASTGLAEHLCRTCSAVAHRHPPSRALDPPTDLAVLTHLIRRLEPTAEHADLFTYCGVNPPPAFVALR